MARLVAWAVLALSAIAGMSGCGTANNWFFLSTEDGGMRIYGGVKNDVEEAKESFSFAFSSMSTPFDRFTSGIEGIFQTADLPLSAIADTLILPCTFMTGLKRKDSAPTEANIEERQLWAAENGGMTYHPDPKKPTPSTATSSPDN